MIWGDGRRLASDSLVHAAQASGAFDEVATFEAGSGPDKATRWGAFTPLQWAWAEAAVHAFDAQLATGTPQPVPAVVALDGIAEFIGISHGTAAPWPHEPARIGLHAAEGESWLVDVTKSGSHLIDGQHETDADLHGSASNLLLALHGRLPLDNLRSEGDRATLENLVNWPDLS
ncbi:hypothetical protein [Streptomyces sp. NPDC059916]|uniref:hypothetical protein n=1 Tax=Streptomyces sp. NPDC059916 TaxID=3347001 RepID=UPI00367DD5BD